MRGDRDPRTLVVGEGEAGVMLGKVLPTESSWQRGQKRTFSRSAIPTTSFRKETACVYLGKENSTVRLAVFDVGGYITGGEFRIGAVRG